MILLRRQHDRPIRGAAIEKIWYEDAVRSTYCKRTRKFMQLIDSCGFSSYSFCPSVCGANPQRNKFMLFIISDTDCMCKWRLTSTKNGKSYGRWSGKVSRAKDQGGWEWSKIRKLRRLGIKPFRSCRHYMLHTQAPNLLCKTFKPWRTHQVLYTTSYFKLPIRFLQ